MNGNEGYRPPGSKRRLTETERVLWTSVTRSVTPLRPVPTVDSAAEAEAAAAPSGNVQPTAEAIALNAGPRPEGTKSMPPPLAPLGRRMRQRIARGGHPIGGRIDLHGLTQSEAHDALLGFLRAARERGAGIVLVITGKGSRAAEFERERGVLRRQVPMWLKLPVFRDLVVGFEPAHAAHGGEGALYVRVRRARANSPTDAG